MNLRRALLMVLLSLSATASFADSAWVSDRLQVGLHEEPTGTSTVLALLPSGTEVEVLKRDGALVHVRTASGSEGWVDAQYLSEEKPAALLLADAEAARTEAERALQAADERIQALESELAAARQASAAAGEAAPGDAAPAVQGPAFEAPVNSETLRELQGLAEENQRLKQQLAESEAAAETARPPTPVLAADYDHYLLALRDWTPWEWLLLASALLLFFGLGLWSAEAGVRHRHGGFRLRI